MPESHIPRRYRMGADGEMRRTWNGRLPEEFTERDALLFLIDTDLRLSGRVSADTLAAVHESGYHYENGALMPIQQEEKKEAIMENGKNTLDVSVKIYPQQDKGNLLAFASATIGGCFAVNGLRVMDGEKGKFVAMPSNKGSDGKYHDICCPTTAEMRKTLDAAVLGAYEQAREAPEPEKAPAKAQEKPSLRNALQSAAKESAARPAPEAPKVDRGER